MDNENTAGQLGSEDASGEVGAADKRALEEAHSRLEVAQKRIDAMLLREINHHASKRLEVASDLFDLGKHELSDLLTDDGDVSAEKVTAAIDGLLSERPNLGNRPMSWGDVGAGARNSDAENNTPDWSAALRGRHA
ncbi:hypothetical protein [Streptomyces sp. NBC_01439]|uniref:hypothetical protein n=1 Tax=Streptomyces sp. NBC_01439 TaxID=2903867 RepID=UPI002E299847|nr:hypothetical protein [Streptomyces sp. NBC_01439]